MNDLQIFNYQDTAVRTVMVDGEPWFVLADLCKVLDIVNVGNVATRLDEVNVRLADVENSRGQSRKTVVTSEAGMYEVVIRSDKSEAVAFRRWITREVLPSIRRTGGYGQVAPSGPELVALALLEANKMLEQKDAVIHELEPKADAYEAFMNADGTYSIGRVAKMLGRSQNKLFADLRNAGVLIAKGHMHNTPYQQYMHHFKVSPYSYERRDGSMGCSYTTTVQPSGVEFIRRKLGIPFVQREFEVVS